MKIKTQYLFIAITIFSGLSLFFLITMKHVMPHIILDSLMDIGSVRNLPPEDLSKMAVSLGEKTDIKPMHISLSFLTFLSGVLGICASFDKK